MLYQIKRETPNGSWSAIEIKEFVDNQSAHEYLKTLQESKGPYSATLLITGKQKHIHKNIKRIHEKTFFVMMLCFRCFVLYKCK